jgi:hypothetical protein
MGVKELFLAVFSSSSLSSPPFTNAGGSFRRMAVGGETGEIQCFTEQFVLSPQQMPKVSLAHRRGIFTKHPT